MLIGLADGCKLNVEELGEGFPLIVLHGGPGLDHQMFRPYLDPLAEEFRVLYVDERGQGRSDRVAPETLSLDRFARDVDLLAEAMALERFALLGHSFGAIITTYHATELGTAAAYVISGGADESAAMLADVEASLKALGEAGEPIAASWEEEKTVQTEAQLSELLRVEMPFHFHGQPPDGYAEKMVGSPEVLRHFANAGYGDFDHRPKSQASPGRRWSSSASTTGRRRRVPPAAGPISRRGPPLPERRRSSRVIAGRAAPPQPSIPHPGRPAHDREAPQPAI